MGGISRVGKKFHLMNECWKMTILLFSILLKGHNGVLQNIQKYFLYILSEILALRAAPCNLRNLAF